LVDDNRLVACDDCDGFARTTALAHYEFLGLPLVSVATLPLSRVSAEIKHSLPSAERERLEVLCDSGFGSYPLGAPEALFSRGERVIATLASLRMSKPQSLIVVVTGEGSEGESEAVSDLVCALGEDQSRIVTPVGWIPKKPPVQTSSEEIVSVRDIARGPLSIESLSFARGALTVVQGEPGTGKTLLLSEIFKRFAKRKKLSHAGSFGTLKRCFMLERSHTSTGIVLDLLGLGPEFAAEVAKTRVAKERGIVGEDLLTARSKNLCGECSGARDSGEEECLVCRGGVFDHRIGSLPFGRLSVSETMRRPLSEVITVFSLNDSILAVLSAIPEEVRGRLSLGASVASLEPALRAFLAMSAGITRCLTTGGAMKDTLLLMDGPLSTTASFQKLIFDSMVTFLDAGGTILCAAVPKPLEKVASSVIRLFPSSGEQAASRRERFFDLRVSRRVSVHMER
jgi:hypothetical protein